MMRPGAKIWQPTNSPGYHEVPSSIELTATASRTSILSQKPSWTQRHLKGWRVGILTGSILASVVCLINLAATIYGGVRSKVNHDGRKMIWEGDCEKVRKINTGLHLGLNVLSTLLLSASNYGMQCLSAPTRLEVDMAHAQRRWLDIGVLSFRNIRSISGKRATLWALLAASSMPLHLFYNSAVYSSIYAADFVVFTATEDMLLPNATSKALNLNSSSSSHDYFPVAQRLYQSAAIAHNLTNLTVSDCVQAYSPTFQTTYGGLILVTSNSSFKQQSFYFQNNDVGCASDPVYWLCGRDSCMQPYEVDYRACTADGVDTADWQPFGSRVDYCLAETLDQKCKVQLTPNLAYVVVVVNLMKAAILAFTFFSMKENPMMTIGDAVASFLRRKDQTTKNLCLMGKGDVKLWTHGQVHPRPMHVGSKRRRWGSVISKSRWTVFILLYAAILGICGFLLWLGLTAPGVPLQTLLKLGIGAVNPITFIAWSIPSEGVNGLIVNALVANAPQPILSSIYYAYNGIFTCFLLGVEWNKFSIFRKGLRVSTSPRGAQRTSYMLQLPKRIALPLMLVSAALHWLCSQAIFLVSIDFDTSAGRVTYANGTDYDEFYDTIDVSDQEYITCGYSPIAIIFTVSLGVFMVLAALFMALRKFKTAAMPVAGSCSASISACCHVLSNDEPEPDTGEDAGLLGSQYPLGTGRRGNSSYSVASSWDDDRRSSRRTSGYSSTWEADIKTEHEIGTEAALLPVKWGVTETMIGDSSQTVGHCAFSSREVREPQQGKRFGYM